jgi:3-hydroxy-3-methylglutaryl CoA synthase
LKRESIARAWARQALPGERSVANTDEDSLTLAVAAAMSVLKGVDRSTVDALYFASTTAPYAEKSHADLMATVCDLGGEVAAADFSLSAKAGTSALRAALDAVAAGSARHVLVAAADCPLGHPKSDLEQLAGDAGAALLVGSEDLVAVLLARHSVGNEILDSWRNVGDRFPSTAEARFASDKGYDTAMTKAVRGLLAKTGIAADGIARVVLATPGMKDGARLARRLGFAADRLVDPLMTTVGRCGTAQPLLLLAAALESARPGDRILLAAYGNGADAFLFEATDAVGRIAAEAPVTGAVAGGRPLDSYSRYLSFRGILETLPGEPFRTLPSTSAYWREQASILRLHGSRCRRCGTTVTPMNRICPTCRSKDEFDEVALADRRAHVFTYSIDNLAGRSDDPVVVQTVCEDDEKTRYYMLMTDFDASDVSIGMSVEFTFRRVYVGGNYINYYWKCRPAAMEAAR